LAEEPNSAPSASGESNARRRAAELFARGRAAFERGDYEAALVDLRASYELVPAPALLFNIAQALRLAGKCEEAEEQYRRYRDAGLELPSDFDELYEQTRRCADEQRAAKAKDGVTAASVAEEPAAASSSAVAETPATAALPSPEAKQETASTAPSRGPAASTEPAADGSYLRPVGIACFAVAAGSAVLGTLFVVRANEAEAEMESRSRNVGAAWDGDGEDTQAKGRTSAYWATGLYAASAVAAGAGLWLWLSAPSDNTSQVALGVAPSVGGVSTSLRARF
jgi:tetratricopeptide (TPR) repeat protein